MYIPPAKLQKHCFVFILAIWSPGLNSLMSDEKRERGEPRMEIVWGFMGRIGNTRFIRKEEK